MAAPPPAAGAVQVTVAAALPAVAGPMVGAAGTVTGVTAAEAGPVPPALVAATVKVYTVPLVRPATTRLVAGAGTVSVCTAAVAPAAKALSLIHISEPTRLGMIS